MEQKENLQPLEEAPAAAGDPANPLAALKERLRTFRIGNSTALQPLSSDAVAATPLASRQAPKSSQSLGVPATPGGGTGPASTPQPAARQAVAGAAQPASQTKRPSWETELQRMASDEKDSVRQKLAATVLAEPDQPAAWLALIEHEKGRCAAEPGARLTPVLRLHDLAVRKLPRNRRNDAYVGIYVSYAELLGRTSAEEGREMFKFLKNERVGEDSAGFYSAWADLEFRTGNAEKGRQVLQKGFQRRARPLVALQEAWGRHTGEPAPEAQPAPEPSGTANATPAAAPGAAGAGEETEGTVAVSRRAMGERTQSSVSSHSSHSSNSSRESAGSGTVRLRRDGGRAGPGDEDVTVKMGDLNASFATAAPTLSLTPSLLLATPSASVARPAPPGLPSATPSAPAAGGEGAGEAALATPSSGAFAGQENLVAAVRRDFERWRPARPAPGPGPMQAPLRLLLRLPPPFRAASAISGAPPRAPSPVPAAAAAGPSGTGKPAAAAARTRPMLGALSLLGPARRVTAEDATAALLPTHRRPRPEPPPPRPPPPAPAGPSAPPRPPGRPPVSAAAPSAGVEDGAPRQAAAEPSAPPAASSRPPPLPPASARAAAKRGRGEGRAGGAEGRRGRVGEAGGAGGRPGAGEPRLPARPRPPRGGEQGVTGAAAAGLAVSPAAAGGPGSGSGSGRTPGTPPRGRAEGPMSHMAKDGYFRMNGREYIMLELLGRGGSSKVYKVMSPGKHIYALKRVHVDPHDPEAIASFTNEIDLLRRLKGQQHIIQLVDAEIDARQGLIHVLEQVGEIDLHHLLQRQAGRGLNENLIRHYWQQMLEAVHTIHEERIIHSDLKPANFLLVQGDLKLIDFGIARAVPNDTTNIVRENPAGTLNYMAPEAIDGGGGGPGAGPCHKISRASDVWSLGCILYQMVYGKTPFSAITNMMAKMRAICNREHRIELPPIPGGDPALADVIRRCLDRNPRDRPTIPELLSHPFLKPSAANAAAAAAGPGAGAGLRKEQIEAMIRQVAAKQSGKINVETLAEHLLQQFAASGLPVAPGPAPAAPAAPAGPSSRKDSGGGKRQASERAPPPPPPLPPR
eukprot:tig00001486_g8920.t1